MRYLFIPLFIVLGLNAAEVRLSALIGTVTAEKGLIVGESLRIDTKYTVGNDSKIQLLLNNTGVITISQNSIFSIKEISHDAISLFFERGVYKIINLANLDHRLTLHIETPELSMDMTDTIALLKLTPTPVTMICAKASFTIQNQDKTFTARKNEMLVLKNGSLKKEPLNYSIFNAVLNRKKSIDIDDIHRESNQEDPTDLEN